MTMQKDVFKYLNKHKKATNNDLYAAFPDKNVNSLQAYAGQWRKQKKSPESGTSIRQKVFSFLNNKPAAALKDLLKQFPGTNQVSINNYHYQWKKRQSPQKKRLSIKDQVFATINKHPHSSLKELREALPNIKPSSVSGYHTIWKKTQNNVKTFSAPDKQAESGKKRKTIIPEAPEIATNRELIDVLKTTIEAQKGTIELMTAQNKKLRKQQSSIFSNLDDMSKTELAEIEQVMSVYIKGLRKL